MSRVKRLDNNNAADNGDGACSPCTTLADGNGAAPSEERRRKNGAVALQCAYCGERTRSRAELEAHTRAHSGAAAARHKCLICDEVLPSAAVLAEHKLTHCKVCIYKVIFSRKFFWNTRKSLWPIYGQQSLKLFPKLAYTFRWWQEIRARDAELGSRPKNRS